MSVAAGRVSAVPGTLLSSGVGVLCAFPVVDLCDSGCQSHLVAGVSRCCVLQPPHRDVTWGGPTLFSLSLQLEILQDVEVMLGHLLHFWGTEAGSKPAPCMRSCMEMAQFCWQMLAYLGTLWSSAGT